MGITIKIDELIMDTEDAIGSIELCLRVGDLRRPFDYFQYSVKNGRQVLLGHHDNGPVDSNLTIEKPYTKSVNHIFMSKGRQYRKAYSWAELRDLLFDGWIIGTERYPGVKIWFASTGRNSRRETDRILVHI